ncbi:tautomerase family protein [Chryseobacterium wangxinyae]|uniref:tautomerase family protein n=1 Tax=Chryseobacterium sp. CY353 TaxID=2997334 RepID=UPI0022704B54|nr:tautomerase family protein [Chryseobacterium sp. CY353]MCY0970876.1 tautomerase family protein [Chryseobacterium sp. CY353]
MIETFAAPELDCYQIIHENKRGLIKAFDIDVGYTRTQKITIIQITRQGHNRVQKIKIYSLMSQKLEKISIPSTDLIISLTANTKEDWSFGLVKHNS